MLCCLKVLLAVGISIFSFLASSVLVTVTNEYEKQLKQIERLNNADKSYDDEV